MPAKPFLGIFSINIAETSQKIYRLTVNGSIYLIQWPGSWPICCAISQRHFMIFFNAILTHTSHNTSSMARDAEDAFVATAAAVPCVDFLKGLIAGMGGYVVIYYIGRVILVWMKYTKELYDIIIHTFCTKGVRGWNISRVHKSRFRASFFLFHISPPPPGVASAAQEMHKDLPDHIKSLHVGGVVIYKWYSDW